MKNRTGTNRIDRLRTRQDAFLQDTVERRMRCPEEQRAAADIARDVYTSTEEGSEVLRRAEFLTAFAERMPIRVEPDERIVGSMLFNFYRQPRPEDLAADAPWFEGNGGHVVADYGRMLRLGVCGLRREIDAMPSDTDRQHRNRQAFGRTLCAFARFIRRHAERAAALGMSDVASACAHVAESPPETFQQALQLTWFMHVFLHAEGSAAAISFGRFDQFLWPYLERDLADGMTTMRDAEELVACFWLKCCEGDESQNIVLGGCDADGSNAENPLSLLCLKVTRDLAVWQPSVSVRIAPDTSEHFWQQALELCAAGFGMPSFFWDPTVIASLTCAGLPLPRARDWAIVGCYEATPQGDCLARTVHGQWVLPRSLLDYLDTAPDNQTASFASFKEGFKAHLAREVSDCLRPQWQARWDYMSRTQVSPFRSLCMPGCCESGLCAEEGGTRFNLFGINILGIGTLIDSLWVLKRLVFDTGDTSLHEITTQLRANWPDAGILQRCRQLPGKFGSDSPETNALAAEFAHHIADLVLEQPLEHGVQPYPGLFIFTGWAQMNLPATPDGRRDGEPLSYGVGPTTLCTGKTPTSTLKSSARTANDRCGCGNPMFLTLNRDDSAGTAGRTRLRHLIETYFLQGGTHIHVNILDAAQLREAQADPENHAELLVRISGLSAQFVALDRRLQDALIARVEQGV